MWSTGAYLLFSRHKRWTMSTYWLKLFRFLFEMSCTFPTKILLFSKRFLGTGVLENLLWFPVTGKTDSVLIVSWHSRATLKNPSLSVEIFGQLNWESKKFTCDCCFFAPFLWCFYVWLKKPTFSFSRSCKKEIYKRKQTEEKLVGNCKISETYLKFASKCEPFQPT